MKKQLAIAAGILLTLGTAVSGTMQETSAARTTTSESASADVGSVQSAQIVSLWNAHATSAGSVRLARPL